MHNICKYWHFINNEIGFFGEADMLHCCCYCCYCCCWHKWKPLQSDTTATSKVGRTIVADLGRWCWGRRRARKKSQGNRHCVEPRQNRLHRIEISMSIMHLMHVRLWIQVNGGAKVFRTWTFLSWFNFLVTSRIDCTAYENPNNVQWP